MAPRIPPSFHVLLSLAFALLGQIPAFADNPLVPDFGMADPHMHIFNNKAYLYTTRDADRNAKKFVMPDWHIWSSDDLINWKHELTILPTETYMGKSTQCWAPDVAAMKGKYYFYFSNGYDDTGVMVGDHPNGPFKDALGKPMLPKGLTSTWEYDATVLVDSGVPYMSFGRRQNQWKTEKESGQPIKYHIVKLKNDMISLAEKPRPIEINGDFAPTDKPDLHVHNGRYYLAAGANYAVASTIYGPYTARRSVVDDTDIYGLNQRAHGNFCAWNNQCFFVWCHFITQGAKFRESYMTYVHYRANGDMDYDRGFLDAHFKDGVGQYSATWKTIEAEWYMAAEHVEKMEKKDGGFEVAGIKNGAWIIFPHVSDVPQNAVLAFTVSAQKGGSIEVHEDRVDGPLMGVCVVPGTGGWSSYQDVSCTLSNSPGKKNLCLVFKGSVPDLLHLDSFRFTAVK